MRIFPVSSGSIYLFHLVRESANTAGLKIQVVCLPLIVTWKELFHKMMKYLYFSIFLSCLFEREKSVVLTAGICSTQLKKVAYASETGTLMHTIVGGVGEQTSQVCDSAYNEDCRHAKSANTVPSRWTFWELCKWPPIKSNPEHQLIHTHILVVFISTCKCYKISFLRRCYMKRGFKSVVEGTLYLI